MLISRVCWVSASPISQGDPAWVSEVSGDAPVPPSSPEIVTWSAPHLLTPAATVPTPISETSFTRDARPPVDVLQIVDQLGQILDRIDIVMRRRRDQANAGRGVPHPARCSYPPYEPGSWPPSPGLAPWAILIWMSSALTRYSVVTPKRPEATCLIAERMESPLGIGVKRSAPRRPRRCWTGRRCGSWRSPAWCAPRG